jgi:hypothetical protein
LFLLTNQEKSMQVNSDFSRTAALKTCQYQWVQSTQPGVERAMLDRIGKERARATSIVRYHPGSLFPTHTHPGGEEIFVLSGAFSDQSGDYPQGWYLRNPPGSYHAPFSREGTTIFVKLWQMQPTDKHVVRINTNDPASWTMKNGRSVCHLYRDRIESTSLQKLTENEKLFSAGYPLVPSELLVLSGSVIYNDIEYIEGSWLRLAKPDLHSVTAGNSGTTVYLKVGEFQNVSHEGSM